MRTVIASAIAIWLAACAVRTQEPPAIVIDRSACSYCGMLISEPAYAAAYRTADGDDRVFDDIGCLAAAVARDGHQDARFWFHDANTGQWIDGAVARFVTAPSLRTPMGGRVLAYATPAAAAQAAERHGGIVLESVASVLTAKGQGHD